MKSLRNMAMATMMAALTLIFLPGCSTSDDDNYSGLQSLVTFAGNVDNASYFTLQEIDDAAPATLYSLNKISNPAIKAGQRMVIRYTIAGEQKVGESGPIELLAYQTVPTSSVEVVPTATAQEADEEMDVLYFQGKYSVFRTGTFINIEVTLPNCASRTFSIYADEATMDNGMPELYITTGTTTMPDNYSSLALASFDIASVWNQPTVNGIKVHINNSNITYPQKVFEFRK